MLSLFVLFCKMIVLGMNRDETELMKPHTLEVTDLELNQLPRLQ
jgi:hypothetical protein